MISSSGQRDVDDVLHQCRSSAEDDHSIGQLHRFVDVVGDEEDGDAKITLKRQQQVFEFRAGLRIDGPKVGAHMEVECMAYTPRV